MGASSCTNDKYKIVQDQYGNEFKRYVIREKNKLFLEREIAKIKKNVDLAARKSEKMYLAQIEEGEKQVNSYYNRIKKQLNDRQPGGITALEQMTKKKVEDILSFSHIKQLFSDFKQQAEKTIKTEENEIIGELNSILLQYEAQHAEEYTSLSLLNALPEEEKQMIMRRGEMDFQNEILKTQEYIVEFYNQQLQMQYYEQRLFNIDCRTQLLKLILLSKDKLMTALNLILAEHIGTYILLK